MPRRLVRRDALWLSLIVALFVLLAVQLPYGTRGFEQPSHSPVMRLLETPGRLLGWGGAALLVVSLAYALVTWMRGQSPGRVLAILGTLVFSVAIGAFAGALASSPQHGGGLVAGGLARMLVESLGHFPAALVLAVIAIPGLLLALAPLLLDSPNRPVSGQGDTKDTLAKPWYPERRVGPDGLEVPMQLPGTDVGPIRYREPGDDPHAPAPAAPRTPVDAALPHDASGERRSKRITGVRFQDEDPAAPPEPPPEPTKDPHLAPGVRFAEPAAPAVTSDVKARAAASDLPEPSSEGDVAETAPPPAPAPAAPKKKGKRAAAPEAAAPPEPKSAVATTKSSVTTKSTAPAAEPAPPKQAATSNGTAAHAPAAVAESVAEPVAETPAAAPTYRGKLAATGIFEAAAPVVARGAKPPTPKPRPATSRSIDDALKSLFSSLPLDELPPARTPEVEEPPPAEPPPPKDHPNQTTLFTRSGAAVGVETRPAKAASRATAAAPPAARPAARPAATPAAPPAAKPAAKPEAPRTKAKTPAGKHPAAGDALFPAAVEAAIERGSASLVLLKRRLNVGYERAEGLMEALVAEGIVGEMTASGSRPTLVTAADWSKRK